MSFKCKHHNVVIDNNNQALKPSCGCSFVEGTPPSDPFPVPWQVRTLMIVAANGEVVLHMGGQHARLQPDDLVALNERIVRAVNKEAEETEDEQGDILYEEDEDVDD